MNCWTGMLAKIAWGLAVVAFCAPPTQAIEESELLKLLTTSVESSDRPAIQAALMRGMLAGLAGRRNVPAPKGWPALAKTLAKSDSQEVRSLAENLSQLFGDEAAIRQALARVPDASQPIAARRGALRSLLQQKHPSVSSLLAGLLKEPELRADAIRGYAAIENPEAAKILLSNYPDWPAEHQRAVLETLATRKIYAESLLKAVQAKRVAAADVPAHVIRSLSLILEEPTQKVFGEVRKLATDKKSLMAKYKKQLTAERLDKAEAGLGRKVFAKTCASCHKLYGVGGDIGPDLTGSNRANLDYILLNSVDPSYDVPAGYRVVVIQTLDGRVVNGVVAEEDDQRIVLKTVEQPRLTVLKSDIEERMTSSKSMMPEGQLEQMKSDEVANLIKYLKTTAQVEVKP